MSEIVNYTQERYERREATLSLHREVSDAVAAWADGSGEFTQEDKRLGLALATQLVAQYGLDIKAIAELGFDPERVAQRVLEEARKHDRSWDKEDHYLVAARGVEVTYRVLVQKIQDDHGVQIAAIQAVRGSVDRYAAQVAKMAHGVQVPLEELARKLVEPGDVIEVMSYLRSRITDWGVSWWHHDRQSEADLERTLRLRTSDRGLPGVAGEMSAKDALVGQRMLVVVGGPGAGKTWLARRYAREAAQAALSALEDGVGLDDVELPLLTTWDQWAKTGGTTRESLVDSSFAAGLGHSDLGGVDTSVRIRRTFLREQTRVLAVVDSLDEAADNAAQRDRLYELGRLPGWRIVVTSRPAAWNATFRGDALSASALRVGELQDLTYPEDVEGFIRDWFADLGRPERAEELIVQIRRPDLARAAVVPLVTTFYCLLAEQPGDDPLPARRRDLYRRLTHRLLEGRWSGKPSSQGTIDADHCQDIMAEWAWSAVRDKVTPAGLGAWSDSFAEPKTPRDKALSEAERRAIDHLAPRVADDGWGKTTRRFIHRTFLEHFVAEHIAALDTDMAAVILLPHIWFDPDWQFAAPAAIIAHNQRERGALLQQVTDRALRRQTRPGLEAADEEIELLLLAIAEASEPADWTEEHQHLIHHCRIDNVTRYPNLVAASLHWQHSNQHARIRILHALPHASPHDASNLAEAMARLDPTEDNLQQTRATILSSLPRTAPHEAGNLLMVLAGLEPTDDDLVQARSFFLYTLAQAPGHALNLADVLNYLDPTEDDLQQARATILKALPASAPQDARYLTDALNYLDPTEDDLHQGRTTILKSLVNIGDTAGRVLVEALNYLDPTDDDLAQARDTILKKLPDADPQDAGTLAEVLAGLEPSDDDLAQARDTILRTLLNTGTGAGAVAAAGLVYLDPTDNDKAQARVTILNTLPDAGPWTGDLLRVLARLNPVDDDRKQAYVSILGILHQNGPWDTRDLAWAFEFLALTDMDRAQARATVRKLLSRADHVDTRFLAEALIGLKPTDDDLAEARIALLKTLPHVDPAYVDVLSDLLGRLEPTDDDLARAREAFLSILPNAHPQATRFLPQALDHLHLTDEDQTRARAAILDTLQNADPWDIEYLAVVLVSLHLTDNDRIKARDSILNALTHAESREVARLLAVLRSLLPFESWLALLKDN